MPDMSRAAVQRLIRDGNVTRNGVVAYDPSASTAAGETLLLAVPPPAAALPLAERIPLDVAYEDGEVLVIDKPAGLVVHPAAGHGSGTLVNALLAHCAGSLSGIGGVKRPGIVHRLDKDTTGLLVVAKSDRAHRSLAEQFADHGRHGPLRRAYVALAWGDPQGRRFTIDLPLARSRGNREKIAPDPGGRHAVTHVEVLERFGPAGLPPVACLLRCTLETGRTHQIRVHLASAGHPLLGDRLYGAGFATKAGRLPEQARDALDALGRQALHAAQLRFEHPATRQVVDLASEPPPDMRRLIDALRGWQHSRSE